MNHPESRLLALVCTVALEADPVEAILDDSTGLIIGRKRAVRGALAGRPILLLPTGMGKTNAAQGLTALLESHPVAGVIAFGVGGAYPGSGLATGGVAVATRETYGDEGVAAPQGWLSTREIGIPLLDAREPIFNTLALDPVRVGRAVEALHQADIPAVAGPFVTVSTCSGTLARGAELAARFGAVCESMEGAASAHVSRLYEAPFLEVRGVSNLVEDRDLGHWKLREAAAAAAAAVEILVRNWHACV